MKPSRWQKRHIHFERIVWGASGVVACLLILVMLALGYSLETAGIFFILIFVAMRLALAFLFKNRYGNSMVRILKFDHEEIERDFRIVFKNHHISYKRTSKDEGYCYEFPWHRLSMTVEPYWLSYERDKPVTKVTLRVINEKNSAFADMLAQSIDEMANERAYNLANA